MLLCAVFSLALLGTISAAEEQTFGLVSSLGSAKSKPFLFLYKYLPRFESRVHDSTQRSKSVFVYDFNIKLLLLFGLLRMASITQRRLPGRARPGRQRQ